MTRLAIIHFSAIESYPPVQNLIRELEKRISTDQVVLLTSYPVAGISLFKTNSEKVKVVRLIKFDRKNNALLRLWHYLYFNTVSLLRLFLFRPKRILYYETLSSFPAYVYRHFVSRNLEIFIHYHEYTSPIEYRTAMILMRVFHQLELWLYPRAAWVSHTNEYRMELFRNDLLPVRLKENFILPNYPPKNWFHPPKAAFSTPVRIVYAGALSLDMMYTKEFARWVVNQNGAVTWHLYSSNFNEQAVAYLKELDSNWIEFRSGVPYEALPEILRSFDIGVILYSGAIPNHVHSVSNKLFEYLSCGLDVWFPKEIEGSLAYCTTRTYPKVLALDFTETRAWPLHDLLSREGLSYEAYSHFCEDTLKELVSRLS
jgi:hypothetical protein